jgi:hypothetical protein
MGIAKGGGGPRLSDSVTVKPYVKRQRRHAADAEAICEAVQRTSMQFVPIKMPEQQAGLVLHRTRHLFVRQLTAVINSIRAHLAEFGVVAPVGRNGVDELVAVINDRMDDRIPDLVRTCLTALFVFRRLEPLGNGAMHGFAIDAELASNGGNRQALPMKIQNHHEFPEFYHRDAPSSQRKSIGDLVAAGPARAHSGRLGIMKTGGFSNAMFGEN